MTTTSLGHIYKIICKVDEKFCYIGSTFNRLSKRMEQHRNNYNKWVNGKYNRPCACVSYFQKYGIENFKIILIKTYEVCRTHNKDAKHLWAYETLWMNKTKCVNKNLPIAYLRLERNREYYHKNRDDILVKKREYAKKHKEEINAKHREKVKCEFCKSLVIKNNLSRHQRTQKCLKAQGK